MDEELLASIVVAVQGDFRIFRLLRSLLVQTVPTHVYEIIVVENGSAQLADAGAAGDGVVRYKNLVDSNMAAARNIGLNAARGCYLLLTDADVVAHPDWINQMCRRLSEGDCAAVGGRIEKLNPRTWTQRYAITIVDGQAKLSYLPALALPYVAGANAGFVTAAVRKVGGFDERFKSGNDVDLCYRLGLSGYKMGLAPKAIVFHEDRPDVVAHFRRFKHYAVYQVLLYAAYRHISHSRFVINTYPMIRVAQSIAAIPIAAIALMRGDIGPSSRALLQIVEALGVWCGDIEGSIRYRQIYL